MAKLEPPDIHHQQRGKDEVKKMALADADLKPLWEYIRAL